MSSMLLSLSHQVWSNHCIHNILTKFAYTNLQVVKMVEYVLDRVQNIDGIEVNAGYPHFLVSHSFETASVLG